MQRVVQVLRSLHLLLYILCLLLNGMFQERTNDRIRCIVCWLSIPVGQMGTMRTLARHDFRFGMRVHFGRISCYPKSSRARYPLALCLLLCLLPPYDAFHLCFSILSVFPVSSLQLHFSIGWTAMTHFFNLTDTSLLHLFMSCFNVDTYFGAS